jgi:hypothetical protein
VEEIAPRLKPRKQFCVRFHEEGELADLKQLAANARMPVAAYLRHLVQREKERQDRRSRR